MLESVRKELVKNGIALFVSLDNSERQGDHTTAWFSITFADVDTGATYSINWASEAQDKGDKGLNKAATAAVKYCLLKTFLIPTGDGDPDGDGAMQPQPSRPAQSVDGPMERPLQPQQVKSAIAVKVAAKPSSDPATDKQAGLLASLFEEAFTPSEHSKDMRHEAMGWLFDGRNSAKELTKAEASATIDWLLDKSIPDDYVLHPDAPTEAQRIYHAAMEAQGQQPLPM